MRNKWIIRSRSLQAYWSNAQGWVYSVNDATHLEEKVQQERLPTAGVPDVECVPLTADMPLFDPA